MPLYGGSSNRNLRSDGLVMASVGNSIGAAWNGPTTFNEPMIANSMAGNVLKYPNIIASTRTTSSGSYGYSGQLLAAIIADLPTQFFLPLDNAGVVPDLVWAGALLENDLGVGTRTYAQMVADIDTFISLIRSKWQNVKILIATPRPSFSYSTAQQKQDYTAISNYILSLDNGINTFAYLTNQYENFLDPATPIKTVVRGTVASNVLTVTSVSSGPGVEYACRVTNSSMYISEFQTGRGGVGTYLISGGTHAEVTEEADISIFNYTDASVHPNPLGTYLNAKESALALNRIAENVTAKNIIIASNPNLVGSIAATGTGISGTIPSGMAMVAVANNTAICTALNPGVRLQLNYSTDSNTHSASARITLMDLSTTRPITSVIPFIRFKIISGAETLRSFRLYIKKTDNGILEASIPFPTIAGASRDGGFEEGTEYKLVGQRINSVGGALISTLAMFAWVEFNPHCTGVSPVVEIYEASYIIPEENYGTVVLADGAATITVGGKLQANSKIRLSNITPAGTPGALFVSARTNGTSFVITSTSNTDTSVVAWEIDN